MISVVCVYNDQRILRDVLLKSLDIQTVDFELITLDNTDNKFSSAAEALNFGGEKAKGDYILFAHQDMWLSSDSWLEEVERMLESIPDLGIAGVAGVSEKNRTDKKRRKWSIDVYNEVWCGGGNKRVQRPEEVQTLDECLLIIPRSVFAKLQFDAEVFDGWDCYGADYCLSVKQLGLKAYVIPASCSHSCARRKGYQPWEFKELFKFQKKLYIKHRKNYKLIDTWMGEVSWYKLKLYSMHDFLGPFWLRIFPDITVTVKRELSGCDTVLDLGCGYHSLIQRFNIPFSVGVELFEPALQESKRKNIHNQYVKADIRTVEFKPKSFDAVIALGVLEHLTKQEGTELINRMERWAKRKIVLTTPNGYCVSTCLDGYDGYANNPLQEHRSDWTVEELRKLELRVFGSGGWKRLRGYKGSLKYKPTFIWTRISDLSQKIVYYYPGQAFEMLAVKQIDEGDMG